MTGSRTTRSPRTRSSPSRVLALRLRSRTDAQKRRYARIVHGMARQRNERLPLITLQALLRKQLREGEENAQLADAVGSANSTEWKDRVQGLRARGYTERDINFWVWIVSGRDGDNRVERFVCSHEPQPTFLLLLLLRSDEKFREPRSLLKLMDYVQKKLLADTQQRSLPQRRPRHILTVPQLLMFLRRLVVHIQRLWPMSIVTVARFVADCIRALPSDDPQTYEDRCKIFNTALWLFKRPASVQPIRNMEFNWRAQKILLATSDSFKKPLLINKESYRAMRQVMVGLKRSSAEKAVAIRYTKSWPPYRQDFDGRDARRTPQDDQSRSFKAGLLMHEAGYDKDDYDRALDVLGGIAQESPTIQTRSLAPKEWHGSKEQQNRFSYWAMRVRATRNAHEAWSAFRSCPEPNIQVYAEMFFKLKAPMANLDAGHLPGSSRETLPMHDANYSEFELARQAPPTVDQLYNQMIERGIKPEGYCLNKLVSEARSTDEALRYLEDSGMQDYSIQALTAHEEPSHQALRRVPLQLFASYIHLLCNLQPRQERRKQFARQDLFRINTAIRLARTRLTADSTEGVTFRTPWYSICSTLAAENLRLHRRSPTTSYDNEALMMQMEVLQHVTSTIGVDPQLFLHYCQTVQKATLTELRKLQRIGENESEAPPISANEHILPMRTQALGVAHAIFRELTKPIGVADEYIGLHEVPKFLHMLGPAHLHTYMRTLAFLEDFEGMAALLEWMLDHEQIMVEECERVGPRGDALIARTLCAFQAFGKPLLSTERLGMLNERVEASSAWAWPTEEQVESKPASDLDEDEPTFPHSSGRFSILLPASTLVNPKSSFGGFIPPAKEISERQAVELFERHTRQGHDPEYMDIILQDFCIYVDSKVYQDEFRPLQALGTLQGNSLFYFDGVIHIGDQELFLRKIAFSNLPIGGYDDDYETVRNQIWVHSTYNMKRGRPLYYRLGKPAVEYRRFFTPFVWVADLAKHFIGFCESSRSENRRVVLGDLKDQFRVHLLAKHQSSAVIQEWITGNKDTDFRTADFIAHVKPGDVVSTHMDKPDVTTTKWKLEPSIHHEEYHVWMARVQHVHVHPTTSARSFDVLWLYHPRDTSCGRMKYPWRKELFLSDNCTCHSGGTRVKEEEIHAIHEVEWFGNESSTAEFFVRQIYLPSQNRWERLRSTHFDCSADESWMADLLVGDTVLGIKTGSDRCLEPLLLEGFYTDARGKSWSIVRRFSAFDSRTTYQHSSSQRPANELLWTSTTLKIRSSQLHRRCYIRVLDIDEHVPAPYDRNGTGDLFYIRRTAINASGVARIRQGFDPQKSIDAQLRGLDLFCGGGNFGRGLEEGGAVEMQWANDLSQEAIHTYMANSNPSCQPFLGSIDDLLRQVIQGKPDMPRPGDVDFISGGSPCPGFSRLTQDKSTMHQQKNRSLSASFVSAVDCLRPSFGVLENVKQIVEEGAKKDACVLSQLICALVGLGYQTQLMWLDAWSFGAPQSRERVFLCFASPGTRLPRMPEPSHSHPPSVKMQRLGKMSNGEPYGQREDVRTPFSFISSSAATADLPDIQDGKAGYCIGFPDHRLSIGYTPRLRRQLSLVPLRPYGLDISKIAYSHGGEEPILPLSKRYVFPHRAFVDMPSKNKSRGWGRVHPYGLFRTVTTACQPEDAVTGTWSHWAQNRPLTVLEARRAQGFLDHEVLLGGPTEQWKVVGNSVSRHVALALGLAFREAWVGTLLDDAQCGT
ncbi:hypothetical protein Micbo1qcDRAFT_148776 [Microdochium bolleyi]|uniref:DNA (cytosine-5-)-methyltransferase n=1 Tax=Microdochium bolleyi TaxID=196109 RepID=A0A136J0K7_9PEZI|nr:hypothetical protein Micbo1qcDRAFT_148776 [Microdochium bolleyi]